MKREINSKRGLKGLAMVTVLVFMLLITIIAGAVLSLMTKQARLSEHQIRRVRAFYAAESAINKAFQSLRYVNTAPGAGAPAGWAAAGSGVWQWVWGDFEWNANASPVVIRPVTVYYNTNNVPTSVLGVGILQGRELRANLDYSP